VDGAALLSAAQGFAPPTEFPQNSSGARVARALDTLAQEIPAAASDIRWIRRTLTADLPETTAKAMEALVDALRRASQSTALRGRVVDAVREDLAIKAAVCRKTPDGMRTLGRVVARTWSTLQPGKEVSNWDVHYLIAPLALVGSLPGESFPAFSSPTTVKLPPGRYVLWAQDPRSSDRRGPSREIVVGSLDGGAPETTTVDLVIGDK
jgi:hypothetical protein